MQKNIIVLLLIVLTTNTSYAYNDYFRLKNPLAYNLGHQPYHGINSIFNRFLPQNKYYNSEYSNSLSKIFKPKNLINNNFSQISDYEYLLSRMEQTQFGNTYQNSDINERLDRLESEIFGASQSGDITIRLNRLKHAYSAESINKNKNNNLKSFFTYGYPTSIPADRGYYSSLDNDFYSW